MYYGFEKDYAFFEEFAVAIDEYIDYYNNKRIQAKTKWMPPVKYRETSMMSAQLINMCPGFWVHITLVKKCWLLLNCYIIKYAVYYVILWLEYNNTIVAVK